MPAHKFWTDDRIDFIRIHAMNNTDQELADLLTVSTGRRVTREAVRVARSLSDIPCYYKSPKGHHGYK